MGIFKVGLFRVVIVQKMYAEIPVYAKSAEDAIAYVESTDEWVSGGDLDYVIYEGKFSPIHAEIVNNPAQSNWDSDVLPWGTKEGISVVEAMFGLPSIDIYSPEFDELPDEEQQRLEKEYDEFMDDKCKLYEFAYENRECPYNYMLNSALYEKSPK